MKPESTKPGCKSCTFVGPGKVKTSIFVIKSNLRHDCFYVFLCQFSLQLFIDFFYQVVGFASSLNPFFYRVRGFPIAFHKVLFKWQNEGDNRSCLKENFFWVQVMRTIGSRYRVSVPGFAAAALIILSILFLSRILVSPEIHFHRLL